MEAADTTKNASSEKRQLKLAELIKRSQTLGIHLGDIAAIKQSPHFAPDILSHVPTRRCLFIPIASVILVGIIYLTATYFLNTMDHCLIRLPSAVSAAFRPPTECDFCAGITEVERTAGISPDEFEQRYAYTGRPVIVTDATENWTALEIFDYWYFKEVYEDAYRKGRKINCDFFPYKSGLQTFREALNMSAERVNFEEGTKPWYFGWSNCNTAVANILRQYYGRPYFLPKMSENYPTDWLFIGGPGFGAQMHVDNVRLPSWQAQIKGSKEWTLAPPPECFYSCSFMKAVVKSGEIIVLDTNKWYHKTEVQSGQTSICIGAEFD